MQVERTVIIIIDPKRRLQFKQASLNYPYIIFFIVLHASPYCSANTSIE